MLHTTCKQLDYLTNLCFLQPFHCRKTISLVPFQYFLIYAQNISTMTTPTVVWYAFITGQNHGVVKMDTRQSVTRDRMSATILNRNENTTFLPHSFELGGVRVRRMAIACAAAKHW